MEHAPVEAKHYSPHYDEKEEGIRVYVRIGFADKIDGHLTIKLNL